MSPAVWRWRWRDRARRLGDEHPATRAAFGRYVASVGGALPETHGSAWRSWARATGQPLTANRSQRAHRCT